MKEKFITYETRIDLKYYAVLYHNTVYLTTSCNAHSLSLKGCSGVYFGGNLMWKIARLYENKELSSKGITWDNETIGVLYVVPGSLRETFENFPFWADISYEVERNFWEDIRYEVGRKIVRQIYSHNKAGYKAVIQYGRSVVSSVPTMENGILVIKEEIEGIER